MTWRDERRPGSYRGVPFEAVELASSHGRNVVVDEYPESEEHTTDDLGRKATTFKLRLYLAGDDVLDWRDALLAALDRGSAGELVHPWRGRLLVRAQSWDLTQGIEGGYAPIDVSFVEVGTTAIAPVVRVDEDAAVEAAQKAVIAGAGAAADEASAVDAGPYNAAIVYYYALEIQDAVGVIGLTFDDAARVGLDLDEGAFTGAAVAALFALVTDAGRLLRYIGRRSSFGGVFADSSGSPTEAAAAGAFATILQSLRLIAIARLCTVATAAGYTSADDAEAAVASLSDVFDAEASSVDDADLFAALVDLRAATTDALLSAADRLPRLRTIDVPAPTPALVLAFDLYGTERIEARAAEIVALNKISHPGFIVGPIRVLSR